MTHIPTPTIQLDGNDIVGPMGTYYGTLTGANPLFADRLVICVNSHNALVAALRLIAQQQTWNECYSATPQLRKTKSDLSCELDTAIETARAALAALDKAEA